MKMNTEKKINKLKEKLSTQYKHYHAEVYKLMKSIYDLRIKENEKYNLVDLSNESVISELFDYHYVATIMNISKISTSTKKLIDQGTFTLFEVANTLRKSSILQNKTAQNQFFKKQAKLIESGKITKTEFRQQIIKVNKIPQKMSEEHIWLLQTVHEIKTVKKYISSRFHKLSPLNKAKVKREVIELNNFIKGTKDKEITLVPIKKDTLKLLRLIKIKGIGGLNDSDKIKRLIEHYTTRDIAKCKMCKKPFPKKRKDQVFCKPTCKNKYTQKVRK